MRIDTVGIRELGNEVPVHNQDLRTSSFRHIFLGKMDPFFTITGTGSIKDIPVPPYMQ